MADLALPSVDRLLELVAKMDGQSVLVVADLVLDRFLTGTPKRISREAPVLILRYQGEQAVPGGGANAIANVRALGGVPLACGVVGDDASGTALRDELARRGVDGAQIAVVPGYRTPTKTRILAGFPHGSKQQVVRFDREEMLPDEEGLERELAAHVLACAGRARVAIVSDYGYGAAAPGLRGAVRQAIGSDGILVVDSRFRLGEFRGVDGATPNEEEAELLAGSPLPADPPGLFATAEQLRRELALSFLLVTRGSRGMVLAREVGAFSLPVHGTDQVADVTGAGDTVIGTFALALAAGATPEEATLLANYAGGVVVMKMGTATLDRHELAAAVKSDARPREEAQWVKW